jgi:hypothetical protein
MRKGLRCLLLLVTCAVFVSNASPVLPNCDPQFNGDMDDKWFELTGREEGKELDGNRVRETSRRERVFIHSWALGCNEMIFDIYSKEGGEWTLVETLWGVRVFPGTNGNRGILAYHTGVIDTVAGFQQVGANGDGFALMTLGGVHRAPQGIDQQDEHGYMGRGGAGGLHATPASQGKHHTGPGLVRGDAAIARKQARRGAGIIEPRVPSAVAAPSGPAPAPRCAPDPRSCL